MQLDEFTQAYIDCLFEETIEEGPMNDGGYGPIGDDFTAEDICPHSLKWITRDCADFQAENAEDIARRASEFQEGEAKIGRTISISDAVSYVTRE